MTAAAGQAGCAEAMPVGGMAIKEGGGALAAQAAAPTPARRPRTFHAVLLLAALAFLAYANSLGNGFVFDDDMLLTTAIKFQHLEKFPRIRPLRYALLAVEHYVFGHNPAGYRTVSVLLHALNGSLLFLIFRLLLGRPWPALVAAVLFIVHPIQTESVAYIAGQRDVEFTAFYLFGFLSYVRYRATGRTGPLIAAGLAYLLGLFTKEMAITLPLLCVAYDVVRSLPGAGAATASPLLVAVRQGVLAAFARGKGLYLLMAAVLSLFLLYFVFVANISSQPSLYGGGLGPTLLTSARIVVHYLKQLIFPITLNADTFGAFATSHSLADPRGLLALLLLSGLWYGLFLLLRIDRWATFGGVWYFLTLLPVSQIVPHQEMVAEHFLYLPSIGFCLFVALFVERGLALRRARTAVAALSAVVVLSLGIRTVLRNRDWKDPLTLWTKSVQAAPQSYWAHKQLGNAYRSLGRYEEAIREYGIVQGLTPGFVDDDIAIGELYRRLRQYDQAVDRFRKALAVSPDSIAARLGLVQTFLAMGAIEKAREEHQRIARFSSKKVRRLRALGERRMARGLLEEAVQAYRRGLELDPFDATLRAGLGGAYSALGKPQEAEAAYREAVKLAPRSAEAHANLGAHLLQTDQPAPAAQALQEALQLAPDYAEAHNNLGIAYYRLGRQADAEGEFRRALTLQPASTEFRQNLALAQSRPADPSLVELERAVREGPASAKAHFNLGSAYGNQGDLTRAAQEFQRALQLDPTNPRIHYAVGLLRYRQSDREAARRAWERALQLDPAFALARERLAELNNTAAPVAGQSR